MNQAQELAKTQKNLPKEDSGVALLNEVRGKQLVVGWNSSEAEYP